MIQRLIIRTLALSLVASLMAFSFACSSSDDVPDEEVAEQPSEPEDRPVVLYQYQFQPGSMTIATGTSITFQNQDPESHNVNIPALNVDENIEPNQEWTYTFDTEGEFAVGNRFSEGMQLDLTVE